MTNPNNAVGTNGAFGGRTSVNAFNDIMGAFQSRGILSGWAISPSSGMTVSCGGDATTRDVAIAEDPNGNKTSINNISGAPINVTLDSAPASNSRYDAIVAYVDKPPTGNATQDNPECCGIIKVTGTAASTPSYPNDGAIRSAITSDGASGATAYYAILGYVLVASGTTTITSAMITGAGNPVINAALGPNSVGTSQIQNDAVTTAKINNGAVTSDKIDSTTLLSSSWGATYNSTKNFDSSPIGYRYLEFFCAEIGGREIYCRMYNPQVGKKISICAVVTGNNGVADTFARSCVLELTNTGVKCVASGQISVATNGSITQSTSVSINIFRVIGYN